MVWNAANDPQEHPDPEPSEAIEEHTRAWLNETWRELRNGANAARMAYFAGAVDLAKDLGILNREEQAGWIARAKRCPGHDDEGGRDWCAYGCNMKALRAAGDTA